MNNNNFPSKGKGAFGLDENIAAALCYSLGFITGIIFFISEKESKFVKFHAMQSIITFVSIWVLRFLVDLVPLIGWLLSLLLSPLTLVLWIVLILKAHRYEYFKLPIIGDIAEEQSSL